MNNRAILGLGLLSLVGLVALQASPAYAQCGTCTGVPETVTFDGWSFQFVRPCLTQTTTAGGRGGGIELRNGFFHGRQVFFKVHTPVLDVKYRNDACGPYRDWQYGESRFQCSPVVSAGRCNGAATTNCANPAGGDVGSFCGVSVNAANPNELVLTTVLSAGWYRYQLEYHFFPNGTFRPAIRWTAVPNPCLNNIHIHFVYWRIDYDIEGSANNNIDEYNDVILAINYWNTPGWDNQFVEMTRQKDTFETRWWRQRNGVTGRAYLIQSPSAFGDLANDDFAAVIPQIGDVWALRYNAALQEETDDGGSFSRFWIQIGKFIDYTPPNDSLVNQDDVFWYGAAHSHLGTGVPPPCDVVNGPYSRPDPAGPAW